MNNIYDYIIVGSSPIAMTRAILEAKKGKTVLIVEKEAIIGGSWKNIQSKDFGNIETGCHIMYRNHKINQFLKKEIGINMRDCNPQPIIIKGKKVRDYKYMSYVNHSELSILKLIKGFPKYTSEILNPAKFTYPAGGSLEMINQFKKALKKYDIEVVQKKVSEITLKDNLLTINKDNSVGARKMVLTPNIDFDLIIDGNNSYNFPKAEQRTVSNLFILFDYFQKPLVSYAGVKNHFIFRVSDMTYHQKEAGRLYCIQIRSEYLKEKQTDEIVTEILDYLSSKNLLPKNYQMKKFKLLPYFYTHRMYSSKNNIPQQFTNKIELLYTHNFSHGLLTLLNSSGSY